MKHCGAERGTQFLSQYFEYFLRYSTSIAYPKGYLRDGTPWQFLQMQLAGGRVLGIFLEILLRVTPPRQAQHLRDNVGAQIYVGSDVYRCRRPSRPVFKMTAKE